METLTISKDNLRDAIYKEMGNPIAEEKIVEKIKSILQLGGKVQCTLEDITIPVYLNDKGEIILGYGIENS